MKCPSFLLIFFMSLVILSCSDKNDEPKTKEELLIGYWAITNIQLVEHIGGVHNTTDKEIPAHGSDQSGIEENYRYDVLIFDDDFATVRGDMPSCPKLSEYEDTPEGQLQYMNDFDNWMSSIGNLTDMLACPVGKYSIKDNDLIIGSLNMGTIKFNNDNEFTLTYTKYLSGSSDFRRYSYTYSRIYSLIL